MMARMVVAGAALLLPAAAGAHDMDALYAAAKQEGTLNLYGGGPAASFIARAKKFEQRFPGVTVNVVGGFSNRLTGQIDEARRSGKPHADLTMLQTIQDFVRWKREGALLAFKPDGWDTIAAQFKDPDGTFMGHYVTLLAYAYRPDLIGAPPRAARDFLKAAFKGRLISTYPHDDDITLYHYARLVDRYGWGFMDDYIKLEPKFVMGHLGVAQALTKGEAAGSLDQMVYANDKSVAVIPTEEPATVFAQTLAIFRDAPHPNAAKLYVNWYLSKEEAATLRAPGRWSVRADVAPPDGFGPLSQYRFNDRFQQFMTEDPAALDVLRARFKRYTGEVQGPEIR